MLGSPIKQPWTWDSWALLLELWELENASSRNTPFLCIALHRLLTEASPNWGEGQAGILAKPRERVREEKWREGGRGLFGAIFNLSTDTHHSNTFIPLYWEHTWMIMKHAYIQDLTIIKSIAFKKALQCPLWYHNRCYDYIIIPIMICIVTS